MSRLLRAMPRLSNWKLEAMLLTIRDAKPARINLSSGKGVTLIGDAGAEALAAAVLAQARDTDKSGGSVTHIDLQANAISDAGACALAAIIPQCPHLEQLNLQWNDVGDEGAAALAQVLKANLTLRLLGLFGNARVTDHGVGALSSAMSVNRTMKTLTVGLGPPGVVHADSARRFKSVLRTRVLAISLLDALKALRGSPLTTPPTALDLGGSKVGNAGCKALAELLRCNRSVKKINLSSCGVGDEGAQLLSSMLCSNKTIHEIVMNNSNLTDGMKKKITEKWGGRFLV